MKYNNIIIEKGNPGLHDGVIIDLNGTSFAKDIPVYLNFTGRPAIGFADLRLEDGVVKADIEVKDEYCVEVVVTNLIPAVGIKVLEKDTSNDRVITKSEINQLSLSYMKNADESIKSLGEQIKNQNV